MHVLGASSWNLNYHCSFEAVTALLQAIHTPWQSNMHIKSHLTASSRMQISFEFIPFDCSQWNLLLTIYSATLDTHGMSFLLTDIVWYWLKQHDASIYTWPCNLYAAITFCTVLGYQLWSLLQLHRVYVNSSTDDNPCWPLNCFRCFRGTQYLGVGRCSGIERRCQLPQ